MVLSSQSLSFGPSQFLLALLSLFWPFSVPFGPQSLWPFASPGCGRLSALFFGRAPRLSQGARARTQRRWSPCSGSWRPAARTPGLRRAPADAGGSPPPVLGNGGPARRFFLEPLDFFDWISVVLAWFPFKQTPFDWIFRWGLFDWFPWKKAGCPQKRDTPE